MPLFGRTHEPVSTAETTRPIGSDPAVNDTPRRRSTLFRSHRSPSPTATTITQHTNRSTNSQSPRRGVLHRDHEDASITNARERVFSAEAAERDADKALLTARAAVREAREHVKRLEREAAEE